MTVGRTGRFCCKAGVVCVVVCTAKVVVVCTVTVDTGACCVKQMPGCITVAGGSGNQAAVTGHVTVTVGTGVCMHHADHITAVTGGGTVAAPAQLTG